MQESLVSVTISRAAVDVPLASECTIPSEMISNEEATHAWRKLVQPPSIPKSRVYTPFSFDPCTRVIAERLRVGVVRQDTRSSPAAAPMKVRDVPLGCPTETQLDKPKRER